ncbi:MAG: rRNA maturation RNase YbeY [Firmicutes bacterium HGW-Firmicutes-13]|nr:MAG: rRNA maturation RNase YbeY [Firmicutes bacterium HGW-Firmicutes-13]
MALIINNLQKKISLPKGCPSLFKEITRQVLKGEKISSRVEVSLCFVDNIYIKELNRRYRKKDEVTDVLSFPQVDDDTFKSTLESPEVLLGDIVISLERAREQAQAAGHSLLQEVTLLFVHGLLHLLGYDHGSDKEFEKMEQKTGKIMEKIDYSIYNV